MLIFWLKIAHFGLKMTVFSFFSPKNVNFDLKISDFFYYFLSWISSSFPP